MKGWSALPMTPSALDACRVLVVDDNQDAADTLAVLTGMWGYESRVAYCASSALELAATWLPQVALLDLAMPEVDGYELARQLHKLPGLERTILISVTGLCQTQAGTRSSDNGFFARLLKPVNPDDLKALLAIVSPVPGSARPKARSARETTRGDMVPAFVDSACEVDGSASEPALALWGAYVCFCAAVKAEAGTFTSFFRRLEEHGGQLGLNGRVKGLKLRQNLRGDEVGVPSSLSPLRKAEGPLTLFARASRAAAIGLAHARELARNLEETAVLYEELLADNLLSKETSRRLRQWLLKVRRRTRDASGLRLLARPTRNC